MWKKIRQFCRDEAGAELIEFIGVVPLLLVIGLIIWQLMLVAQTFVVVSSAAREGARRAAVCDMNYYQAAVNASPGYNDRKIQIQPSGGWSKGDEIAVTVGLKLPTIRIPFVNPDQVPMPWVYSKATMRFEGCP
jgi:Flp pilus assembly pilin Flp